MIAHSMGGLAATRCAVKNPGLVNELIHISTAGAEGPLGLRLVPRAVKEVLGDVLPAIVAGKFGYQPAFGLKTLGYFAQNPTRTVSEIISCMVADTRPATRYLRSNGTPIGYIALEKDIFFTIEAARQKVAHTMDDYQELGLTHIAPQIKAPVVTGAVVDMLLRIEAMQLPNAS